MEFNRRGHLQRNVLLKILKGGDREINVKQSESGKGPLAFLMVEDTTW